MVSLDSFKAEMLNDIEEFSRLYKEKHDEDPVSYPLEIEEENAGVWFEMFEIYCTEGIV